MKPPCEMVVWYVIPAIRSELAKDLLKLGMKQKTISELMDITQPAVSQYLTDKRGSGIEFNDDVKQLIQDFADDLNVDPDEGHGQLLGLRLSSGLGGSVSY